MYIQDCEEKSIRLTRWKILQSGIIREIKRRNIYSNNKLP